MTNAEKIGPFREGKTMSKKSFIDSVEVRTPCDANWNEMTGNDQVRFCGHCAKSVNNISTLRRKDAARLVRSSNGELCIRYIANPVTKRPMFAEQLIQIARRTPGIAAGVMSASISLATMAYGQTQTQKDEPETAVVEKQYVIDQTEVDKIKNSEEKPEKTGGVIRGIIRDNLGKPVPGVFVFLANESHYNGDETVTDEDGEYEFKKLEPETYMLRVQNSAGLIRKVAPGVTLAENETIVQDLNLRTHVLHVDGSGVGSGSSVGSGFGGAYAALEYAIPLNQAVADEDIKLVQELLNSGQNPNGKDANYSGITPLFLAVENGNTAIARLLIQYGAKVNARDETKRTPLMFIDDDATPELITLLLQAGAKVNARDKSGETPLLAAASSAKIEVVQALIDAGADLNADNEEGLTPLMKAVEEERAEIVDALITAGSDINSKDKNGDTAWDKTSDPEIEKALVNAGAIVNYDVEVEVELIDGPAEEQPAEPAPSIPARPR